MSRIAEMLDKVERFFLSHFALVNSWIPLSIWMTFGAGILWARDVIDGWQAMSLLCLCCKVCASLVMLATAGTMYVLSCICWYREGFCDGSGERDW